MKANTLARGYVADVVPQSGLTRAISGLVAAVRKTAAERALRRQLADMDDALLRDIGLGDDEIYRLRQGSHVNPRNWH